MASQAAEVPVPSAEVSRRILGLIASARAARDPSQATSHSASRTSGTTRTHA
ncbi:MAG: hypothetical protein ACRDY0_10205 [Acidimicrobiales bacterium]